MTITASNKEQDLDGDTVTFDGTTPSIDFSVVGLVNSDTVDSITLTSTGAAATATVAGSPYDIVPSAAVGTGLGNYDIAYQNGKLTVDARDLTITASDTTKTYGDTVTFDGTTPSIDFSVVGLVNSDTVDSMTLTSTGAAATATVAGSPYDIVPSARRRHRSRQRRHRLPDRQADTVDARDLTDHRRRRTPSTARERPFLSTIRLRQNPPFSVRYVGHAQRGSVASVLGGARGFTTPATSASLDGLVLRHAGWAEPRRTDEHPLRGGDALNITAGYRVVGGPRARST